MIEVLLQFRSSFFGGNLIGDQLDIYKLEEAVIRVVQKRQIHLW